MSTTDRQGQQLGTSFQKQRPNSFISANLVRRERGTIDTACSVPSQVRLAEHLHRIDMDVNGWINRFDPLRQSSDVANGTGLVVGMHHRDARRVCANQRQQGIAVDLPTCQHRCDLEATKAALTKGLRCFNDRRMLSRRNDQQRRALPLTQCSPAN